MCTIPYRTLWFEPLATGYAQDLAMAVEEDSGSYGSVSCPSRRRRPLPDGAVRKPPKGPFRSRNSGTGSNHESGLPR